MSRILKRPMFRTGGSTNEGIMHGLVDRRRYNIGSTAEKYAKEYEDIFSKIKPPAPRFPLGQIGLNLVSGEFAGDGLLANIAGSARDPYASFVKADDARSGMDYQTKMLATKMGISRAEEEAIAKAKAAGQSGMQKDNSPQRAYETAVATRKESRSKLDTWQKPDIYQAFPEATSEHDILVLRNLRATNDPTGKMISANRMGYVPYDQKTGEFNYENMLPGAFYYDPRIRAFVQRVPDDPKTPENESGYFKYDKNTFEKYVMDTSTKPPSWKKLGTN